MVSKTTGRRFEPCTARQVPHLARGIIVSTLCLIWCICLYRVCKHPFYRALTLSNPNGLDVIRGKVYGEDMNARTWARHEVEMNLCALRRQADHYLKLRETARCSEAVLIQKVHPSDLGVHPINFDLHFAPREEFDEDSFPQRQFFFSDPERRITATALVQATSQVDGAGQGYKFTIWRHNALVVWLDLAIGQLLRVLQSVPRRLARLEKSTSDAVTRGIHPPPLEQHPSVQASAPNTPG